MRGLRRALAPLFAARGLPRVLLWVGISLTAVFVILAVFAPLIAPYGFDQYAADGVRFPQQAAPSIHHLLGTTVQSDDVLSRIIWGARTSIEVVLLALLLSIVVGVPLGLVSGYFGGWLDRILVLINDSLIAFPYLLLAIVIAFLLQGSIGGGVATAAFAITVIYIPQYFRVVRNSVLSVREEPYVEAGRVLGAPPRTVIRRYVFANVVQSVPVLASLNAADAILTLAALSFLGIGIDPSAAAEWGYDISRGIDDAQAGYWWTGLFPGLAIILLVTGLTLVGESLNDSINPLLRQRRFTAMAMPKAGLEPALAPETAGTSVIKVRDLRVWYGSERGPVQAVDGVSLDVRQGEMLGVVGESGCGKSTLARGLLGLLPAGAVRDGLVEFDGRNLVELPSEEMRWLRGPSLGMVFQEPMTRLDPLMRVSAHFAEALRTHEPELSDTEVRRRSLDALAGMGIPPTRFGNYPYEFSGGMRQRILIALTLVLGPKFVVADEPTTALDVLVEAQILEILADVKRNFDTSILFITHNLGIVAEACDRVAVMYAGRVVEQGPVSAVFADPQHPYTRELLASTISLRTTGLRYIEGSPPDLLSPPSGCRFHPRCPDVMAVCSERFPPSVELGGGHPVECWLHV
ncbi:MAG TPA: dipeptide/oligopeptide/nickel ABC transporter permease/ATP-binding protein [Mycobacteriales bacterium]|jgi:peptide/nickel transport system permease protein|nr:dipeptide/oligopeptide/nickel ABC transporter permease/ATP-binding protein [Mycobacteriales bacterium]